MVGENCEIQLHCYYTKVVLRFMNCNDIVVVPESEQSCVHSKVAAERLKINVCMSDPSKAAL